MSATVDELTEQLLRFLPERFLAARELVAGQAAMLAHVLRVAEHDFVPTTTIGGSRGIWLTLLARGYGIERATDESNDSVRTRIRSVEDALTVEAIESAVNGLLSVYTEETCTLLEHWAELRACDVDDVEVAAICDITDLYDQYRGMTLIVPLVDGDENHPVYSAIVSEVNRLKAAGARWWMVLADT